MSKDPNIPLLDHELAEDEIAWMRDLYADFAAARAAATEVGLAGLRMRDLGNRVGMRAQSLYTYFPSKAAIPGLTRVFAVELGTRNPRVRVNAVLPGPVMLPPEVAGAEREAVIAGTLVKREGGPEHVARAVLHFVENDFVTGACLPVDGGRSVFAHGG